MYRKTRGIRPRGSFFLAIPFIGQCYARLKGPDCIFGKQATAITPWSNAARPSWIVTVGDCAWTSVQPLPLTPRAAQRTIPPGRWPSSHHTSRVGAIR